MFSALILALGIGVFTACGNAVPEQTARTTETATVAANETETTASPTPTEAVVVTPVAPTPPPPPASDPTFFIEQVFSWVDLDSPTFLAEVPDNTGRLVVLEQSGFILEFDGDPTGPAMEPRVFLDIRDRVNRGGNEEGLLGLAFHPDFAANGRTFVYYSAASPRRSVISEFHVDVDDRPDPDSERVILEVGQPYSNHNGGMLAFGVDGYLYIGLGDGGSGGDPQGNGQDPSTLLGSILRIDVDTDDPYAIPPDNPFADGRGGAPEVWAYGFRNPWRFAFSPVGEALWVADVGQDRFEEVSVVRSGGNYGWNVVEGPTCYRAATCDQVGLEPPVAWYDHGDGCSVTGGYVNWDPLTPTLNGYFLVADYCSGTVWRIDDNSPNGLTRIVESNLNISSFGEAVDGTLYLVSAGGQPGIYRIVQGD